LAETSVVEGNRSSADGWSSCCHACMRLYAWVSCGKSPRWRSMTGG